MSLTEFPVEKSLDQCKWLFYAVILGFFLCAIYEIFRAFRSEIRHKKFAVFLEDVFFFVICAFVFFCFSIISEDGKIRIYCLVGCFAGSVICRMTAGKYIKKFFSLIIGLFTRIYRFAAEKISVLIKKGRAWSAKQKINLKKKDKKVKKALKKEVKV